MRQYRLECTTPLCEFVASYLEGETAVDAEALMDTHLQENLTHKVNRLFQWSEAP